MALMTVGNSYITGTAGEALSQYNLVTISPVNGYYYKADANSTDTIADAVGIVMQRNGISSGSEGSIQVKPGLITNLSWEWNPGDRLYVGLTGAITNDASGYSYSKEIGYATSATQISFNPQLGVSNDGDEVELNPDQFEIDYIPANYTRTLTQGTTSVKQLAAHLAGIDAKLTGL